MCIFKRLSTVGVSLVLVIWVAGCYSTIQEAEQIDKRRSSFTNVYGILKLNCVACHSENGSGKQAWSLNVPPTADKYPICNAASDQFLCTTYYELTGTEWPWIVAADPGASQPFVNACDVEQSYHIGTSIPERLSDEDCALFEEWILKGAELN